MLRAMLASVSVGTLGAVLSQFCACSSLSWTSSFSASNGSLGIFDRGDCATSSGQCPFRM